MDRPRPPQTGIQVVDNILIALWPVLVWVNFSFEPGAFANVCVGLGAIVGALLTALRIYEHLAGETVAKTVLEKEDGDALE
jgi:hypothetical protein